MWGSGKITYDKLKSGGYQLLAPAWVQTKILGNACMVTNRRTEQVLLRLTQDGRLYVEPGYQWDGASGPVIDRASNMRAGLFHDACYQLMRSSKLGQDKREKADELFRDLCIADGGYKALAQIDYAGLRLFGAFAAAPQPEVEDHPLQAP